MISLTYHVILLGAGLALLSILASFLSHRLGAPSLLIFLVIGMLAGEDGPGGIQFDNFQLSFLCGNLALAVILLDGGLRTRLSTFRVGLWPAISLATVGVILTTAIVGLSATWLLDLSWQEGLLIGAIVGSTDAAAVFGLLHAAGLELKQRCSATLEIESGINDPMAIFLTVALVTLLQKGEAAITWNFLNQLVQQMGLGLALGLAGGRAVAFLINSLVLPIALYSLLVTAFGLVLFSLTNLWGGSGFLAIYVLGLLLGNTRLNHLHDIRRLHDGLAWLSQIGMFLMLGLLVTPARLPAVALPALIVAFVLIFIARPLAVFVSLAYFRFPWREQVFVSWVGLKGAVPIILALYPLLAGLEHQQVFFELTFFVVLISLCLQGWSIAPMARWLKLEVPPTYEELQHFGLTLPGRFGGELLTYRVRAQSPATECPLTKLPLPQGVELLGVIRQGKRLEIREENRLAAEDFVVLLSQAPDLGGVTHMFRSQQLPGRLDTTTFFGEFVLAPQTLLSELADSYGCPVTDEQKEKSVGEFMMKTFGGKPVVGDRIALGGIELVVKEISDGVIMQVGLKLV